MKNKIIIIVAIVIVAIAVGVVGFIFVNNFNQEKLLRSEIDKISKLDFEKEEIDMEIKTKGDYAKVEQTIKEYLNTYATTVKETSKLLENEQFSEILTAENYKNDGPDFIKSKEFISFTKDDFNQKINLLIEMTNEEKILKAIEDKNLSQEYIDLYKNIMIGEDGISDDLKETEEALKEASKLMNDVLDVEEKVIDMLIKNKGKWKINDNGEIEFSTPALVEEYNKYIKGL